MVKLRIPIHTPGNDNIFCVALPEKPFSSNFYQKKKPKLEKRNKLPGLHSIKINIFSEQEFPLSNPLKLMLLLGKPQKKGRGG